MQNLFIRLLGLLSSLTGKNVLYFTGKYANENNLAVKTKFGFWYCGNVLDYTDIAYGFANNGTIEEADMSIVETIINNANGVSPYVFYDIGSNTGPYSLLALTLSRTAQVHSFDPVKEHLSTLRQSVMLNRYEERSTLHEIALSDKGGEATLHLAGSGSTLEKDFLNSDSPTRAITLATIDGYVKEKDLPDPHFIKIDVEGHEFAAIKGGLSLLERSSPVLFIEIALHLANIGRDFTNQNFKEIFSVLENMGYASYIADNGKLEKVSPTFDKQGVYMYLFLHKDKELKDENLLKKLGITL